MKKTLEIGDLVRLRSGGPAMVVAACNYSGCPVLWLCMWMTEGKLQESAFPIQTLEEVKDLSQ